MHWVLGRDDAFLNSVGDIDVLPRVLEAAQRFVERPSDDRMAAMHRAQAAEPLFT